MLPLIRARYRARLCGAPTWEQNKNSGNWQTAVPFTVTQGEHAGETITWIGILHGTVDKNGVSGEERVIASFQYMGWQGDNISELAELTDQQAMQMMPEEVDLSCAPETYDGKTRLKVQWVNKAGAGRFAFKEPAKRSDLRAFGAQLKATVKATRQTNGVAPKNGTGGSSGGGGGSAPPASDDSIPF